MICKWQQKLISFFIPFLFLSPAFAQVQPSYFLLGAEQFEGAQIYDVIQDNELNYWIATDNGIYRYDSYVFTKTACPGAKSTAVFEFVKNRNGTIYCYNLYNQILQISNGVCSVLHELQPAERSADIALCITPQNELLVVTKTILLFAENGTQIAVPPVHPSYYGFPFVTASAKTISHMADTDTLLVLTNHQIAYVNMNTGSKAPDGALKFFTLSNTVYAIASASKQIYRFNEADYSLTSMAPTDLEKTPEPLRIYNVNDRAWAAGVISGVRVLTGKGSLTLSEVFYPEYLISDVYEDAEGNILLSTFNYGILVVPDVDVPDVLHLPAGLSVTGIQTDSVLGMLMGTLTGKLIAYNNGVCTTLSDSGARPLQAIFSWPEFPFIIYDDGRIKVRHKETGKTVKLPVGVLKDADDAGDSVVYLAMNIGVTRMKWNGGSTFECTFITALSLRCYAVEYAENDRLTYVVTSDGVKVLDESGNVTALMFDGQPVYANDLSYADGIMYVGTHTGILQCSGGKVLRSVTPAIQNEPVEILKLKAGNGVIHAVTSAGFARFSTDGTLLMHLNTTQGFSTNRIYDFELAGNDLWISHSNGVQKLDAALLSVPVSKPLLRIGSLHVNDSLHSTAAAGSFSSAERKFIFTISSPTLRNKENIRYHYQLSGYEETWFTAWYSDNEIVYNALAPGDYTFTVKAENSGVFSEPVSYSFTIAAPFYTQWWFTAVVILVLLLTVTLIYRYRLQVQRRKSQLENELQASRLTAIQSQMNPHFIFNSLNSIQDLVLKGDVDNSYTFITKFSNLVRRTLNYSDKDFIEFSQEIKLLELYLALEKLRFRDDLEFTIETNGVDDILIPPMLIQPFIENSLLHGLLHKEGKKRLTISFQLRENLVCMIEDNGIGREKAKEIKNRQRGEHESFSGEAIRKRFSILSRLFKSELGYIYEDMYDGAHATGTRVKLTIPVKHNY